MDILITLLFALLLLIGKFIFSVIYFILLSVSLIITFGLILLIFYGCICAINRNP